MTRCEYRIKENEKSIIFYFTPGNFTSTCKRKPYICAYIKQGKELLNFDTSTLYLNGEKPKVSIENDTISCFPKEPLETGTYAVKLLIEDRDGNPQEFSWNFIIQDELLEYNFYYGIPHAHTSYSDGAGTPTEAYEKARDSGLNFLIITDHQGKLVKGKYNHDGSILISGSPQPKWEMLKLEASAVTIKYEDFCALYGFELSTKFWGHINIINSKNIIKKKPNDLKELYEWLITEENILLSVNHPHRSPKTLPFTNNFDNFVNLYEVGNGSTTRVYIRTEKNYYNALDSGWHIAAINGQDNHSSDWGDSPNVTAVIAKELSVNSILEAIRLRRIYSTESKSLKLVVKGNNQWMGSVITMNKGERLELHIKAEDMNSPIERVQVITNGGKILKEKLVQNHRGTHWDLSLPIDKEYSWYVVKVIHGDGKTSISSALFVQSIS